MFGLWSYFPFTFSVTISRRQPSQILPSAAQSDSAIGSSRPVSQALVTPVHAVQATPFTRSTNVSTGITTPDVPATSGSAVTPASPLVRYDGTPFRLGVLGRADLMFVSPVSSRSRRSRDFPGNGRESGMGPPPIPPDTSQPLFRDRGPLDRLSQVSGPRSKANRPPQYVRSDSSARPPSTLGFPKNSPFNSYRYDQAVLRAAEERSKITSTRGIAPKKASNARYTLSSPYKSQYLGRIRQDPKVPSFLRTPLAPISSRPRPQPLEVVAKPEKEISWKRRPRFVQPPSKRLATPQLPGSFPTHLQVFSLRLDTTPQVVSPSSQTTSRIIPVDDTSMAVESPNLLASHAENVEDTVIASQAEINGGEDLVDAEEEEQEEEQEEEDMPRRGRAKGKGRMIYDHNDQPINAIRTPSPSPDNIRLPRQTSTLAADGMLPLVPHRRRPRSTDDQGGRARDHQRQRVHSPLPAQTSAGPSVVASAVVQDAETAPIAITITNKRARVEDTVEEHAEDTRTACPSARPSIPKKARFEINPIPASSFIQPVFPAIASASSRPEVAINASARYVPFDAPFVNPIVSELQHPRPVRAARAGFLLHRHEMMDEYEKLTDPTTQEAGPALVVHVIAYGDSKDAEARRRRETSEQIAEETLRQQRQAQTVGAVGVEPPIVMPVFMAGATGPTVDMEETGPIASGSSAAISAPVPEAIEAIVETPSTPLVAVPTIASADGQPAAQAATSVSVINSDDVDMPEAPIEPRKVSTQVSNNVEPVQSTVGTVARPESPFPTPFFTRSQSVPTEHEVYTLDESYPNSERKAFDRANASHRLIHVPEMKWMYDYTPKGPLHGVDAYLAEHARAANTATEGAEAPASPVELIAGTSGTGLRPIGFNHLTKPWVYRPGFPLIPSSETMAIRSAFMGYTTGPSPPPAQQTADAEINMQGDGEGHIDSPRWQPSSPVESVDERNQQPARSVSPLSLGAVSAGSRSSSLDFRYAPAVLPPAPTIKSKVEAEADDQSSTDQIAEAAAVSTGDVSTVDEEQARRDALAKAIFDDDDLSDISDDDDQDHVGLIRAPKSVSGDEGEDGDEDEDGDSDPDDDTDVDEDKMERDDDVDGEEELVETASVLPVAPSAFAPSSPPGLVSDVTHGRPRAADHAVYPSESYTDFDTEVSMGESNGPLDNAQILTAVERFLSQQDSENATSTSAPIHHTAFPPTSGLTKVETKEVNVQGDIDIDRDIDADGSEVNEDEDDDLVDYEEMVKRVDDEEADHRAAVALREAQALAVDDDADEDEDEDSAVDGQDAKKEDDAEEDEDADLDTEEDGRPVPAVMPRAIRYFDERYDEDEDELDEVDEDEDDDNHLPQANLGIFGGSIPMRDDEDSMDEEEDPYNSLIRRGEKHSPPSQMQYPSPDINLTANVVRAVDPRIRPGIDPRIKPSIDRSPSAPCLGSSAKAAGGSKANEVSSDDSQLAPSSFDPSQFLSNSSNAFSSYKSTASGSTVPPTDDLVNADTAASGFGSCGFGGWNAVGTDAKTSGSSTTSSRSAFVSFTRGPIASLRGASLDHTVTKSWGDAESGEEPSSTFGEGGELIESGGVAIVNPVKSDLNKKWEIVKAIGFWKRAGLSEDHPRIVALQEQLNLTGQASTSAPTTSSSTSRSSESTFAETLPQPQPTVAGSAATAEAVDETPTAVSTEDEANDAVLALLARSIPDRVFDNGFTPVPDRSAFARSAPSSRSTRLTTFKPFAMAEPVGSVKIGRERDAGQARYGWERDDRQVESVTAFGGGVKRLGRDAFTGFASFTSAAAFGGLSVPEAGGAGSAQSSNPVVGQGQDNTLNSTSKPTPATQQSISSKDVFSVVFPVIKPGDTQNLSEVKNTSSPPGAVLADTNNEGEREKVERPRPSNSSIYTDENVPLSYSSSSIKMLGPDSEHKTPSTTALPSEERSTSPPDRSSTSATSTLRHQASTSTVDPVSIRTSLKRGIDDVDDTFSGRNHTPRAIKKLKEVHLPPTTSNSPPSSNITSPLLPPPTPYVESTTFDATIPVAVTAAPGINASAAGEPLPTLISPSPTVGTSLGINNEAEVSSTALGKRDREDSDSDTSSEDYHSPWDGEAANKRLKMTGQTPPWTITYDSIRTAFVPTAAEVTSPQVIGSPNPLVSSRPKEELQRIQEEYDTTSDEETDSDEEPYGLSTKLDKGKGRAIEAAQVVDDVEVSRHVRSHSPMPQNPYASIPIYPQYGSGIGRLGDQSFGDDSTLYSGSFAPTDLDDQASSTSQDGESSGERDVLDGFGEALLDAAQGLDEFQQTHAAATLFTPASATISPGVAAASPTSACQHVDTPTITPTPSPRLQAVPLPENKEEPEDVSDVNDESDSDGASDTSTDDLDMLADVAAGLEKEDELLNESWRDNPARLSLSGGEIVCSVDVGLRLDQTWPKIYRPMARNVHPPKAHLRNKRDEAIDWTIESGSNRPLPVAPPDEHTLVDEFEIAIYLATRSATPSSSSAHIILPGGSPSSPARRPLIPHKRLWKYHNTYNSCDSNHWQAHYEALKSVHHPTERMCEVLPNFNPLAYRYFRSNRLNGHEVYTKSWSGCISRQQVRLWCPTIPEDPFEVSTDWMFHPIGYQHAASLRDPDTVALDGVMGMDGEDAIAGRWVGGRWYVEDGLFNVDHTRRHPLKETIDFPRQKRRLRRRHAKYVNNVLRVSEHLPSFRPIVDEKESIARMERLGYVKPDDISRSERRQLEGKNLDDATEVHYDQQDLVCTPDEVEDFSEEDYGALVRGLVGYRGDAQRIRGIKAKSEAAVKVDWERDEQWVKDFARRLFGTSHSEATGSVVRSTSDRIRYGSISSIAPYRLHVNMLRSVDSTNAEVSTTAPSSSTDFGQPIPSSSTPLRVKDTETIAPPIPPSSAPLFVERMEMRYAPPEHYDPSQVLTRVPPYSSLARSSSSRALRMEGAKSIYDPLVKTNNDPDVDGSDEEDDEDDEDDDEEETVNRFEREFTAVAEYEAASGIMVDPAIADIEVDDDPLVVIQPEEVDQEGPPSAIEHLEERSLEVEQAVEEEEEEEDSDDEEDDDEDIASQIVRPALPTYLPIAPPSLSSPSRIATSPPFRPVIGRYSPPSPFLSTYTTRPAYSPVSPGYTSTTPPYSPLPPGRVATSPTYSPLSPTAHIASRGGWESVQSSSIPSWERARSLPPLSPYGGIIPVSYLPNVAATSTSTLPSMGMSNRYDRSVRASSEPLAAPSNNGRAASGVPLSMIPPLFRPRAASTPLSPIRATTAPLSPSRAQRVAVAMPRSVVCALEAVPESTSEAMVAETEEQVLEPAGDAVQSDAEAEASQPIPGVSREGAGSVVSTPENTSIGHVDQVDGSGADITSILVAPGDVQVDNSHLTVETTDTAPITSNSARFIASRSVVYLVKNDADESPPILPTDNPARFIASASTIYLNIPEFQGSSTASATGGATAAHSTEPISLVDPERQRELDEAAKNLFSDVSSGKGKDAGTGDTSMLSKLQSKAQKPAGSESSGSASGSRSGTGSIPNFFGNTRTSGSGVSRPPAPTFHFSAPKQASGGSSNTASATPSTGKGKEGQPSSVPASTALPQTPLAPPAPPVETSVPGLSSADRSNAPTGDPSTPSMSSRNARRSYRATVEDAPDIDDPRRKERSTTSEELDFDYLSGNKPASTASKSSNTASEPPPRTQQSAGSSRQAPAASSTARPTSSRSRRKAPASSTSASPAIPPRHSSFFNSWLSTQPDRPTGASIVDTFKPPSAAENRVRERNAHSAAGGPSTSRTRQDRAPSSSASRPSNAGPSTTRPRGPDEVQRAHRDGWQSQVDALREEADVGEAERKRREKRRLLDKVEELKRQYRR